MFNRARNGRFLVFVMGNNRENFWVLYSIKIALLKYKMKILGINLTDLELRDLYIFFYKQGRVYGVTTIYHI